MKIGIDISQLAFENTGVANYLYHFIDNLTKIDSKNQYILFFSSFRHKIQNSKFKIQNYNSNVNIISFKFPPTLLDFVWNKAHIFPIEKLIGDVDVFISSDWTQPPTVKAKKATIIYDMIVYKHPEETHQKIIETQKRRLNWVKNEADMVFCISEATKRDAKKILGIKEDKLRVIYPGI